jgi:hypothetical protein
VRSGEHIFYEPLVAGHVDKSEPVIIDLEIGKAYVNRDATLFFFLEAVRIYPGQRFYKRRFPVIYVARGADYDVLHE